MSYQLSEDEILPIIMRAYEEDVQDGDITSEAIFKGNEISNAYIIAKDNGIFCGGEIVQMVYQELDPDIEIHQLVSDGSLVKNGDKVMTLKGHTKSLLIAERIALNFIQRMSGIATETNKFVKLVENTNIKILDTRKTLPGFRTLDKYSVKTGGGKNHRIGLYDLVLIKDNHIKAAGNITNAVKKVRNAWQDRFKIEVETTTLDEVKEAVDSNVDIIMLDNMDKERMKEAIKIINKQAKIEISGNMNEEKINMLKDLEIDYISIGALTHSVKAFDLSMKFE